jgi:YgiT-type zinc finger domain-containing protein
MKCHVCGAQLHRMVTDRRFKRTDKAIVIIQNLPVLQCENCTEYLLEDSAMAAVEEILGGLDEAAELEIVRYVA